MSDVHEVVVYIHGVMGYDTVEAWDRDTNEMDPFRLDHDRRQYRPFHDRFVDELAHHGKTSEELPRIGIEWGWTRDADAGKGHELLTHAQAHLGERVMEKVERQGDIGSLRPAVNLALGAQGGARRLVMYGIADAFYYTSDEGKADVREATAKQIEKGMRSIGGNNWRNKRFSLTIVSHSGGTLVAFDLLYYLYGAKEKAVDEKFPAVKSLRAMARGAGDDRKLRIRRLCTMGSPITPFAIRSNTVVKKLAHDELLDPKVYGLADTIDFAGDDRLASPRPRWLNFWDRDDLISYPVEPLMHNPAIGGKIVRDLHPDISDDIGKAHDDFWKDERVTKLLARAW